MWYKKNSDAVVCIHAKQIQDFNCCSSGKSDHLPIIIARKRAVCVRLETKMLSCSLP